MTGTAFIALLTEHSIDPHIVTFDDFTGHGYIIRKNYYRRETLIRERDQKYEVLGFPSESDALISLSEKIIKRYQKIKNQPK